MASNPITYGPLGLSDWMTFFGLAVALATYLSAFRQRVFDRIHELNPDGKPLDATARPKYWKERHKLGTHLLAVLPAEWAMIGTCAGLFLERCFAYSQQLLWAQGAFHIAVAFFISGIATLSVLHIIHGFSSITDYQECVRHLEAASMADVTAGEMEKPSGQPYGMFVFSIVVFAIALVGLVCSCR